MKFRYSGFRVLVSCVVALIGSSLPALAQGPVVLMGIDAEDGNGTAGGGHGGHTPYEDVIANGILPSVTNGGAGILVIGGGKSATDDVTEFWTAVSASVGEVPTFVNGAANIASQSFSGFALIAVASSLPQTASGGLSNAENNAFAGRAADLANHVNGGGGLFGTSQQGLGTPYGYLGLVGAFTFNFPPAFDNVDATVEGEAIGITDTNLDICCWHDEYVTFPGFLDVLAVNDDTGSNPCAIGGFDVIIVKGIALTPLTATNFVGEEHTVTATVADSLGDPVVGTLVTFTVTSGPHVGTMGSDFTDANGQAFFTYTGTSVGVDTIEGCFLDSSMVEQCDVVSKEWIPAPQSIVLTPPNATNFLGEEHTVTATVTDDITNDPVVGTLVTFTVTSGPHVGTSDTDVTDANGQAFFSYTGLFVGIDTIGACFVNGDMVEQCAAEVTKEWVALPCFTLDFETEDDFLTPLVNGQHINTEFGDIVLLSSSGENAGIGIFDSTPSGPNDPSQDPDLLVDSGNILILQVENFPPDGNDVFPRPNDDSDGGSIAFAFNVLVEPQSVKLVDVDATDAASSVVLTDGSGRTRTYSVPANWTGDLTLAEPGQGILDLTVLAPQPGFGSVATAVEDAGFDAETVVGLVVNLGGSLGVDDLTCCTTTAQSFVVPHGVGNTAGSFALLSGLPGIGQSVTVGIDDPTGRTPLGAQPLVLLSTLPSSAARGLPTFSHGFVGTLLVDPSHALVLFGNELWTGPGHPAPVALMIPDDPSLIGTSLYAQGALLVWGGVSNSSPSGVSQHGFASAHSLTEAFQFLVGP